MLVFSEDPYVVTPLTDDTAAIQALLAALETKIMPSVGHRADQAIAKAANMFKQSGIFGGAVLLITPRISAEELQKAQALAEREGLTISVLGVGTEEGAPILQPGGGFFKDENGGVVISTLSKDNLQQLANTSRGVYATLSHDGRDLEALKKSLDPSFADSQQDEMQRSEKKHDQGYLLVLCALPLTLLFFRRGMLAVIVLLFPHGLQAFIWSDLWKTADQQGQELFHQENYEQAEKQFENSKWKAAANFRLGEYEKAAELFQNESTANGFYNYGNAQAKQGNLDAALEAYEKTLEIDPTHEDALHNKKILEEFKQQQSQKDQKNGEGDEQSNSQKQPPKKGGDAKKEQSEHPSVDQPQEQNQDAQQPQGQEGDPKEEQDQSSSQSKEEQEQRENGEAGADRQELSDEPEKGDNEKKEEMRQQYQQEMERSLQDHQEEVQAEAVQEEMPSEEDLQKEADDRTLQRIKDDPGGLLRRKFLLQYRQQNRRS